MDLEKAIEQTSGCSARHISTETVLEEFAGEVVWSGEVEIFELVDHPDAERAYGWVYELDDGRRRIATVLGVGAINSALTAVQAYILYGDDPGPTPRSPPPPQ